MEAVLSVIVVVSASVLYVAAVLSGRRSAMRWDARRTLCFVLGMLLLAVALLPPLAAHDDDFTLHIVQHLLMGMFAPVFLALSAPLTLALRNLPPHRRRVLVRILHSAPTRTLTHPTTAAALVVGGLVLLYDTGLYAQSQEREWSHMLVHVHVILAGYLFAAAMVGLDPRKHQPRLLVRCLVLVIAFGAHDTIAKLIYAHGPAA